MLDNRAKLNYNYCRRRMDDKKIHIYAAMAQVAEHILGKDEVTSSNLVSSSTPPRTKGSGGFFTFL